MALGFIKKLYPLISLAAVAGGPLAVEAANAVGAALGVKVDPTSDAIEQAVAKATPEQLVAMKECEQNFQLKMKQLGLESEEDFAKLEVQDRDSARDREKTVRDRTPSIGFYILTFGFFGMLALMMFYAPPAQNAALLNIMLGSLGTAWLSAVYYYYGSSAGSDRKNATIDRAVGILGK